MTGAFEPRALGPALVPLPIELLDLAAREMGLYWRAGRARAGRASLGAIVGETAPTRDVEVLPHPLP